MTEQEKLDLIIQAIIKEREKDPGNPFISLDLAKKKELPRIPIDEIGVIIDYLRKEKILILHDITYPKATDTGDISHYALSQQPCYNIEIVEGFDNWYSHYTYAKENTLENLTFPNIVKIYDVTTKINEMIQLSPTPKISIRLDYRIDPSKIRYPIEAIDDLEKHRGQALDYLQQNGVIIDCVFIAREAYGEPDEPETSVEVNIDTAKLKEFLPKITAIYEERCKQQSPASEKPEKDTEILQETIKKPKREVVYEIKYSENGEIFLNNFLFATVQFDGENETVFKYLFKHPNKKITKAEFKEKAGYSIGKPLHKIVDNLGFTGNLRKAFFHVSEKAILFRNPLTKKELEKLNIPQLKLQKKAVI
ncbi:MAG: hypothetical protein PHU96_00070 [Candidatus Omnitrophica bacterium]|nr:hypothetical protein [Candidatus Omnitrophota bacterium]